MSRPTFYQKNLSDHVARLLVGVVSLSIALFISNYVELYNQYPTAFQSVDIAKRIFLFFVLLSYPCYDLLIYASLQTADSRIENENTSRVIIKFLLDVLQVLILACLIGCLYLENIFNEVGYVLDVSRTLLLSILFFLFLWHCTIILWHISNVSYAKHFFRHGLIGIGYLLAFLLVYRLADESYLANKEAIDWSVAVFILVMVVVLFASGAWGIIGLAIADFHRSAKR